MSMQITRGLATTPAGQLHYRVAGEGPPLLLLHMTNLSSRAYLRLMPLLPMFRTYAPDLPGFGYSDPLDGQPDLQRFAQSVIHFMDELGIQKAHIFGLHAGNKVGAAMAAHWPERVDKFVLSGLTHSLISDQSKRMAAVPDYAHKLHETKKLVEPGLNLKDWALLYGKLAKLWWRPSVVGRDVVSGQELALLEDEILDLLQSRQGYGMFYRASWAFDVGATLAQVMAPSLVVELVTRREEHLGLQGPVLEKLMPNCRALAVQMNDYDFLYRQPQVLAGHLHEFLDTS